MSKEKKQKDEQYSIRGVISRLISIVVVFIFITLFIVGTISMYWLLHWVVTGRLFYSDLFRLTDRINVL